jgi:hypothetical protein
MDDLGFWVFYTALLLAAGIGGTLIGWSIGRGR